MGNTTSFCQCDQARPQLKSAQPPVGLDQALLNESTDSVEDENNFKPVASYPTLAAKRCQERQPSCKIQSRMFRHSRSQRAKQFARQKSNRSAELLRMNSTGSVWRQDSMTRTASVDSYEKSPESDMLDDLLARMVQKADSKHVEEAPDDELVFGSASMNDDEVSTPTTMSVASRQSLEEVPSHEGEVVFTSSLVHDDEVSLAPMAALITATRCIGDSPNAISPTNLAAAAYPSLLMGRKNLEKTDEPAPRSVAERLGKKTSRLNGTWVTHSNSYNAPVYHIISDNQLRWDTQDGRITNLDMKDDSSCKITCEGADVHATLEGTANTLTWSDGDCWTRAGFEGSWKESKSSAVRHIKGMQLSIASGKNDEKISWAPIILNGQSFSMTVGGAVSTALLEDSGQILRWSDGNTWTRLKTSECKQKRLGSL
jgi:hypothetical protein